jgi:SAM-dependent methyltransferase
MSVRDGRPEASFVEASRGTRTFPGDRAENYWFRRHDAAYRLAAQALRDRGAGVVLDVGCGEGYGAARFARFAACHAVELDTEAARHARFTYPGIAVVRADACALPFRPHSFDAVVAMQVLEHLFCADGFLRRAKACLRPGGALLLSTPNRETFSLPGQPNPFHVYEYSAEELAALLQVHFRRVTVGGLHHGVTLRAADRLAGGSFQRLLLETPFDHVHRGLRSIALRTRTSWFRAGPARGSLDLLALAEP